MRIGPVSEAEESALSSGAYVVVLHAGKIPPHLGLFVNGFYYSAAAHKIYMGEEIKALLKVIKRKEIPTLWIKLNADVQEAEVKKIFSDYHQLVGKATCLSPLKDLLKQPHVNFIFELIDELQRQGKISSYSGLYLDLSSDKEVELPVYTLQDIYLHINALKLRNA